MSSDLRNCRFFASLLGLPSLESDSFILIKEQLERKIVEHLKGMLIFALLDCVRNEGLLRDNCLPSKDSPHHIITCQQNLGYKLKGNCKIFLTNGLNMEDSTRHIT